MHIMDHAIENNLLFRNDDDYRYYLNTLKKYIQQENVILHSYCLMPNRIHLLATFPDGNVSRFMQCLKIKYSKYHNNNYQIRGHLFMGRFKSIVVTTNKYLIIASRYIHLNPIAKGIVKEPSDYLWSSYNDILKGISLLHSYLLFSPIITIFRKKFNLFINLYLDKKNYFIIIIV